MFFSIPEYQEFRAAFPRQELQITTDEWFTEFIASVRWETDVPGLYLSGQDVLVGGILPNLVNGVITAGKVLGRSTLLDIFALHHYLETQPLKKCILKNSEAGAGVG